MKRKNEKRENERYGAVRNRVQLDFYVDAPKVLEKFFVVDKILPRIVAAFYPEGDKSLVDFVHLEYYSDFQLKLSSRKQKVTA